VIARLLLTLQYNNPGMRREPICHGGARYTGADYHKVSVNDGMTLYWEISFRRSATFAAVMLEGCAPNRAVT